MLGSRASGRRRRRSAHRSHERPPVGARGIGQRWMTRERNIISHLCDSKLNTAEAVRRRRRGITVHPESCGESRDQVRVVRDCERE
jgi:hypothetical protein